MTTFYVIRHGETDWNRSGRWQGHTDTPLNNAGRSQARSLAARLRTEGVRFDAIYSSDLARAWETAAIVGEALGMAPQALLALREIDLGRWSGLTRAEVIASDGEIFARIESGEDMPRGGGERFADLYDRAVTAVEYLAAAHPRGTLALVTHGGTARALLLHAARNKPGMSVHRAYIGNTALSVLVSNGAGWTFDTINDITHLDDAAPAPDLMATPGEGA